MCANARRETLVLAVLSALIVGLGGCSKSIWITQYPTFYTDSMKGMSIAAVPFKNRTNVKGAGTALSDELASALQQNGTYKVFNRDNLQALLGQRDLQVALGNSDAALAEKFQTVPGLNAKAMLVGTVTTCAGTQTHERRSRQVPCRWDKNGKVLASRTEYFNYYHNEGNIAATAGLVRVSDGKSIHTATANGQAASEGQNPGMDPYACIAAARGKVVAQLLREFAVTRREIKIDPGKAFRTAADLFENKWDWSKKFSTSTAKAYVVLTLPSVCDRNRFRLAIVKKDNERNYLWEESITWQKNWGGRGFAFSPQQLACQAGPGDYIAKFYSGAEPVMTAKFKIEAPK